MTPATDSTGSGGSMTEPNREAKLREATERPVIWSVTSGVWSYVEPVTDDGMGPTYDTSDWVLVVGAKNARAASWVAYHSDQFKEWRREHPRNDWHPLHGFKVARVDNDPDWAEAFSDGCYGGRGGRDFVDARGSDSHVSGAAFDQGEP